MEDEINSAGSISVMAAGLKLEGHIEAQNDVRVDGLILGNIFSNRKVMVGSTGKVVGNINAKEVYVMGEVKGDLYITGRATIGSTGKFTGKIVSGNIQIEPGADVEAFLSKIGVIPNEEKTSPLDNIKEFGTSRSRPSHMEKLK